MSVVAGAHRPQQAEMLGDGRRPRQQFADRHAWHARGDRGELATHFGRSVGLGIPRRMLRGAATEENHDARLGAAAGGTVSRCRGGRGPLVQDFGQ